MDEKRFKRNLSRLLLLNEIEVNKDRNNAFFELMKDDFDDQEFESICVHLAKKQTLYGKYPTPEMFYRCKKDNYTDKQIENARITDEFNRFWSELVANLNASCTAFTGESLPPLAKKTLYAFGGFADLWRSVNRDDGYARSIASIKREMQQFYFDNYTVEKILRIEDHKIKKMLNNISNSLTE